MGAAEFVGYSTHLQFIKKMAQFIQLRSLQNPGLWDIGYGVTVVLEGMDVAQLNRPTERRILPVHEAAGTHPSSQRRPPTRCGRPGVHRKQGGRPSGPE